VVRFVIDKGELLGCDGRSGRDEVGCRLVCWGGTTVGGLQMWGLQRALRCGGAGSVVFGAGWSAMGCDLGG
jgi:hypothetical protein